MSAMVLYPWIATRKRAGVGHEMDIFAVQPLMNPLGVGVLKSQDPREASRFIRGKQFHRELLEALQTGQDQRSGVGRRSHRRR